MIMKKFLSIVVLMLASMAVMAQERMVEVHVDAPIKRNVTTDDLRLGGKMYVPALDGRMLVEANLDYTQAFNQFVNPNADAMQASGKVWVFLTPKTPDGGKVRPFVLGGMTQSLVFDTEDATQFNTGFGVAYNNGKGFGFIPSLEFNTQDLAGRTGVGKEYAGKFRFFIPTGKLYRVNLTPYVSRFEIPGTTLYTTRYGFTVGFGRVF